MAWPTTDDPKTEFVTIRLTVREAAMLDAAAQVAGLSRSAYVRDSVRRVVASDQRKQARLAGREPTKEPTSEGDE